MRKRVQLVKRHADVSVREFRRAWVQTHATEIMQQPSIRRYVLSLPLIRGYQKQDLPFDAVEEIWLTDDTPERDLSGSLPDLLDQERTVAADVEVHVMKRGSLTDDPVKVIELVIRNPRLSSAEFQDHWLGVHGPLAIRIPSVDRYEQNHVLKIEALGGFASVDGFAMLWSASTSAMRDGAQTREYAEATADEAILNAPGPLPIVLAREVLRYRADEA